MRWWRNMKSSAFLDRGSSGSNRAGMKTKKVKPISSSGASPALKFNVAANSMYLGLYSPGGM